MSLEQERIGVLLEALMLAEGRTTSTQSAISRQHPESRPPTMLGPATAQIVLDILDNPGLGSLADRIRMAREIVDLEKRGPPGHMEETETQFAYRVVTQYVGRTTADVARREATYVQKIMKIRRDAGQDNRGFPAKNARRKRK